MTLGQTDATTPQFLQAAQATSTLPPMIRSADEWSRMEKEVCGGVYSTWHTGCDRD